MDIVELIKVMEEKKKQGFEWVNWLGRPIKMWEDYTHLMMTDEDYREMLEGVYNVTIDEMYPTFEDFKTNLEKNPMWVYVHIDKFIKVLQFQKQTGNKILRGE